MAFTAHDIQKAVAYNLQRRYPGDQIKTVQRSVGARDDGVWGPQTVKAVYAWQAANNLAPDGKVGPATWGAIQAAARHDDDTVPCTPVPPEPPAGKPKIGVWIDDPPHIVLHADYFDLARTLGIEVMAVMLDTSKKPWDPIWEPHELEEFGQLAEDRGIERGFTVWPYPTRGVMDPMFEDVRDWVPIIGAKFVESDVEFNWISRFLRGFANMDEASEYLADKMEEAIASVTDGRTESSTFISHVENGPAAKLAPRMKRINNQAYGVRHRNDNDGDPYLVKWDDRLGPGHVVDTTIKRTLQIPGVKEGKIEMGIGQAWYDQGGFPGHTAEEAQHRSWDAAVQHRVVENRGWSSKHVIGVRKKKYVQNFLRQVKAAT